MVGALLTLLTLGIMQLALAVYVRGVAHDAAVEGAYDAALADVTDAEGAARAREVVDRTLGPAFVQDVQTHRTSIGDATMVQMTMRITLPLIGLIGIPAAWEVVAHAPADDSD
ncbi:TadE family protein [Microbacterium sp. 2P01SA-2]|uniref:TadE family protein n=1 Tax=unclassified Microbacterium TaxID=2609290 RepID=UPI00399F4C5B